MSSFEAETRAMHQLIPILGHMGITVVDAGPGHATVELPAGPNGNHFGVLYAGSLFTACEVLGGIVPRASFDLDGELAGYVPLVKSAEINYLRPGLGDVRASGTIAPEEIERVRAEALETGKSNFVMETEIKDAQGTVVATMRATNQLRKMV
ncbi:PaaI family thioesterase [Nocardioides sp. MH1]|uniref:PaaI family thioesterase n=1 Tax=Nocardioides sp. MH1 TaxID=3242490 RepID=UPI003520BB1C